MATPNPQQKEVVSFRFRKGLKEKLVALSEATGRSQTFLVEEALEAYCDLQAWQVAHILEGQAQARAGRLSSTAEALKRLEQAHHARLSVE